jgi:transposase
MAGKPRLPLVLTDAERRTLQGWASRRKTAQGLAQRARIVLLCAEGKSNVAVAAELGITRETVGKWRSRFVRQRFAGLSDEPRPGVPRTITDAQIEEVVVRTLEEAPEGATHWSKRELARQTGLSPTTIYRIWRAFGLKPWLVEEFKVSTDPFLIDKVRDVVGLYLAPPANAAVFSVDEKPQIQAYLGFKASNWTLPRSCRRRRVRDEKDKSGNDERWRRDQRRGRLSPSQTVPR